MNHNAQTRKLDNPQPASIKAMAAAYNIDLVPDSEKWSLVLPAFLLRDDLRERIAALPPIEGHEQIQEAFDAAKEWARVFLEAAMCARCTVCHLWDPDGIRTQLWECRGIYHLMALEEETPKHKTNWPEGLAK